MCRQTEVALDILSVMCCAKRELFFSGGLMRHVGVGGFVLFFFFRCLFALLQVTINSGIAKHKNAMCACRQCLPPCIGWYVYIHVFFFRLQVWHARVSVVGFFFQLLRCACLQWTPFLFLWREAQALFSSEVTGDVPLSACSAA